MLTALGITNVLAVRVGEVLFGSLVEGPSLHPCHYATGATSREGSAHRTTLHQFVLGSFQGLG